MFKKLSVSLLIGLLAENMPYAHMQLVGLIALHVVPLSPTAIHHFVVP